MGKEKASGKLWGKCFFDLFFGLNNNPSSHLETADEKGPDKANDLQFKPAGSHRMDALGQQLGQLTETGLHALASSLTEQLLPRLHCPFGILLAQRLELDARYLFEEIFKRVVVVQLVRINYRSPR